jgi:beta-glucosidase
VSIALDCFAQKRTKLDMVLTPFALSTSGTADISLYNLRIEKNTQAPACPE